MKVLVNTVLENCRHSSAQIPSLASLPLALKGALLVPQEAKQTDRQTDRLRDRLRDRHKLDKTQLREQKGHKRTCFDYAHLMIIIAISPLS